MDEHFDITDVDAADRLSSLGYADTRGALTNLRKLGEGPLGARLSTIVRSASRAPSPEGALNNLETVAKALAPASLAFLAGTPEVLERLITVCGSSPFLSNILARHPEYFDWLFIEGALDEPNGTEGFRDALSKMSAGVDEVDDMARVLRVHRNREYLRIGARDLLGLADLRETAREVSDLASASLDAAVWFSLEELKKSYGRPLYTDEDGAEKEAEFTVIGLGKLGGRELNFSSDIDIIYIYSSDNGETGGVEGKNNSVVSLHSFFVKLSMMIGKLISTVTEDGFVFRVDLDLRPEGGSGVMANSIASAEAYYESWGQTWERAAMIKARPVAGSMALGEEFLTVIRPFVFRKYLDFTSIEEIKSMKEKINLSLLRRAPDVIDVKLGRGGIREIEFLCQALQLIHAGKDTELRERNTIKALEKLSGKRLLHPTDAAELTDAYIFLRNLEHRIQIVDCRQTQAVPARTEELERIARMMGFADTGGRKATEHFFDEYRKVTATVHELFRSLFYKAEEEFTDIPEEILLLLSAELSGEEAAPYLAELGFKDTTTAYNNIELLKSGPSFVRLGARARVLLQKLAPLLLSRAAASPDPDRALAHLERFLSAVGARTTLYSLLYENTAVADELLKLFGTSVFLSRTLIEHPESLDIFLAKELSTPYKPAQEFHEEFSGAVSTKEDFEEKLDALRRLRNLEVFRIGINDIAGDLTARQVSVQLSFLAEAALDAAYRLSYSELARRYGEPRGARFCVFGLGKLGGRELVYGSDLDIIFVYSDNPPGGTTDGVREISNHEFFVKLCQRMISVLTLRTKEGLVFNVDTRLRPSGSSGPLVVSRNAFINYHKGKTQIWERQALLRARAVAVDTAFGAEVLGELEDVVFSGPLTDEEKGELLRIRKRMEAEIAKEDSTRYNIKTGSGGLVDIEFLTQTMQLAYGREKKSLRTPNTRKALLRLFREDLLDDKDYKVLKGAYDFYRLLELGLRVVHDRPEGYLVKDTEELLTLARRVGYTGPGASQSLLEDYRDYAEKVRKLYLNFFG